MNTDNYAVLGYGPNMTGDDVDALAFADKLIRDWPQVYGDECGAALYQFAAQLEQAHLDEPDIMDAADELNRTTFFPSLTNTRLHSIVKAAIDRKPCPVLKPEQPDAETAKITALFEQSNAAEGVKTKSKTGKPLVLRADKDTVVRTDRRQAIKNLLPKTGLAALCGNPGDGKTFDAIDMAEAVANGLSWNGQKVTQGSALYVAAEAVIEDRIAAYHQAHFGAMKDVPFYTVEDSFNLFSNENHVQSLLAAVEQIRAKDQRPMGMIIVDTMACVIADGDENSAKDVGILCGNLRRIGTAAGCIVLIIHHKGKDPKKGMRGSTALWGNVDTWLEIAIDGHNPRVGMITVKKQRDGQIGRTFFRHLDVVTLGTDTEGDPITSCSVVYTNGTNAAVEMAKPIKPDSPADWLQATLGNLSLSTRKAKISKDACLERFRDDYYAGKTSAGLQAFNRAKLALKNAGRLIEDGGYLSLVGDTDAE